MRIHKALVLYIICMTTITSYAQDIWEVPVIKTAKDYHLKGDSITGLYIIEYNAALQERVLKDSTVYLDTVLSRSKESNLKFNVKGQLTSIKVDSFDEKGKTVFSKEDKYLYKGGKLSGIIHYVGDEMTDSTYISYDRHGQIDEQSFFDKKDRLIKVVQYFYRNNRIFNVKVRDEDMGLLNFIRFAYNTNGDIREQEVKGNTMQYLYSYKYSYDTSKEGLITINKYDYVGKYKYRNMHGKAYNQKGQLVEVTVADSNKRVTDYRTLKYNRYGLLHTQLIFTKYKYDYLYTYEYDEKGNWRTKWTFENKVPASKIHRVIEFKKEDS